MIMRESNLGIEFVIDKYKVFFGNNKFTEEKLIDITLQNPIQFMHQIHSSEILEFTDFKDYTCDGLTSLEPNLALAIRTADCLPIFILEGERMFALHAGWRGLVGGIILSTKNFVTFSQSVLVIIGPHIMKGSFEVGHEVVEEAFRFLENHDIPYEKELLVYSQSKNQKPHLDLSYLAICQFLHLGVPNNNITQTKVDTYSDNQWHSYRREGSNAGRNIHLVLKI